MNRTHRTVHKLIWPLLAVLLAGILFGALKDRRGIPENDAVPTVGMTEAD